MRVLAALQESDKLLGVLQGHYAMRDKQGVLHWYNMETNHENYPVSIADIGRDEWQPYHEVKEIRPEKAGELWRYNGKFSWLVVRGIKDLEMVCEDGGEIELIENMDQVFHTEPDDGPWQRAYPHVEDENIDKTEIECPECGLKATVKGICKLQEIVKLKCSNCGCEIPKEV